MSFFLIQKNESGIMMNSIYCICGILCGIVGMEICSYGIHRYIMHGWLWFIHKTHHRRGKHRLELNDVFSLLFAGISIIFLIIGILSVQYFLLGIGAGIILYGILYFIIHDIIVHRRIKTAFPIRHPYLRQIIHAHALHHSTTEKYPSQSFGLLWVPKKYRKIKE